MKWAVLLVLGASPAAAQSVNLCDWQTSAQALVEPWEKNTRVFANGDVRVAAIDTIEPATGAAYLMILSPPRSRTGARQCRVIGWTDQLGFAAIGFGQFDAGYDPSVGLMFDVPVRIATADGSLSNARKLSLTLNQSTGSITTALASGTQ